MIPVILVVAEVSSLPLYLVHFADAVKYVSFKAMASISCFCRSVVKVKAVRVFVWGTKLLRQIIV